MYHGVGNFNQSVIRCRAISTSHHNPAVLACASRKTKQASSGPIDHAGVSKRGGVSKIDGSDEGAQSDLQGQNGPVDADAARVGLMRRLWDFLFPRPAVSIDAALQSVRETTAEAEKLSAGLSKMRETDAAVLKRFQALMETRKGHD